MLPAGRGQPTGRGNFPSVHAPEVPGGSGDRTHADAGRPAVHRHRGDAGRVLVSIQRDRALDPASQPAQRGGRVQVRPVSDDWPASTWSRVERCACRGGDDPSFHRRRRRRTTRPRAHRDTTARRGNRRQRQAWPAGSPVDRGSSAADRRDQRRQLVPVESGDPAGGARRPACPRRNRVAPGPLPPRRNLAPRRSGVRPRHRARRDPAVGDHRHSSPGDPSTRGGERQPGRPPLRALRVGPYRPRRAGGAGVAGHAQVQPLEAGRPAVHARPPTGRPDPLGTARRANRPLGRRGRRGPVVRPLAWATALSGIGARRPAGHYARRAAGASRLRQLPGEPGLRTTGGAVRERGAGAHASHSGSRLGGAVHVPPAPPGTDVVHRCREEPGNGPSRAVSLQHRDRGRRLLPRARNQGRARAWIRGGRCRGIRGRSWS